MMKAMLFCLIVVVILTLVSYAAMTAPLDAPVVAGPAEYSTWDRSHFCLNDGDNGPWL